MKYITLAFILGLTLAGCASMEEAYYADREYGKATTDAFDRQIVHKDYPYAGKTVEGLPALHAESIMETYHGTFAEGFSSESFDISGTGADN